MNSFLTENISLIESDSQCKVIKFDSDDYNLVVLTNKGNVYTWKSSFLENNKPKLLNFSVKVNIIDLCCGDQHTLLLTKFGNVYAFGNNCEGRLGCGFKSSYESELRPIKVLFQENQKITSISCGQSHSLALSHSGNVYSWGLNDTGQLGINSLSNQDKPVLIEMLDNNEIISIKKIACGLKHSLLLSVNGDVYSFGGNGQYRSSKSYSVCGKQRIIWIQKFPLKLKCELKFVDISAHFNKSIALSETGKFYIWGQCGRNLFERPTEIEAKSFAHIYEQFASTEESIENNLNIKNEKTEEIETTYNVKILKVLLTVGNNYTFLANTGKVFAYNSNEENHFYRTIDKEKSIEEIKIMIENNDSNLVKSWLSLERKFPEPVVDICAGFDYFLYLTNVGSVYSSGNNNFGQCGCVDYFSLKNIAAQCFSNISIKNHLTIFRDLANNHSKSLENLNSFCKIIQYPTKVTGLESKRIVAISCGDWHSLLLTSNGEVYGSGCNTEGQLGVNPEECESIHGFIQSFERKSIKIACGSYHSLVLTDDNCVYGFGNNTNGQCGNGLTNRMQWKPVTYDENLKFVDIFAFKNFSMALSDSGQCYVWGNCLQIDLNKPTKMAFRSFEDTIKSYKNFHSENLNDKIKSTSQYQWYQSWNMLGEGNFSKVVKSNNRLDEKDYAVRVRAINYDKIPEIWKELNIWRKLKSDYVTTVLDFWFDENTDQSSQNLVKYNMESEKQSLLLSIKTEVCDTTLTDLMKIINEEFKLKELEKLNKMAYLISSQIFLQILEGVDYLHRQTPPVIHRDLKPDNILILINVNTNKFIRINDFGLSEDYIPEKLSLDINAGTPKYKAPDKTITTKSDLYSLGIIMSDLMHIDMNSFEDYEIETNNMIDLKYKNLANICEQLIEHRINQRPRIFQLLISKDLWSISSKEICAKDVDNKNPLLKEILKKISTIDLNFDLDLINDLHHNSIENINESFSNYVKNVSPNPSNFVKVFNSLLALIQQNLITGNIINIIWIVVDFYNKFKLFMTEEFTRYFVTMLIPLLILYPEDAKIVEFTLNTLLQFRIPEQNEFEFTELVNLVLQIIQNENTIKPIQEKACCLIMYLSQDKSKRYIIGTDYGMKILIKQIYSNGKLNNSKTTQEFVWTTLMAITDENEIICENFCNAGGLDVFRECYESNVNYKYVMFGVLQNIAECAQLRHHLLNEWLLKMFLEIFTDLKFSPSSEVRKDLLAVGLQWLNKFKQLKNCRETVWNKTEINCSDDANMSAVVNNKVENSCVAEKVENKFTDSDKVESISEQEKIAIRFSIAGIVAYLLLIESDLWNLLLPNTSADLFKELLNNEIPKWKIETKRLVNYNSFKPFLEILLSNFSPIESKYFIIWQIANLICTKSAQYCPYLKEDNLLIIIESIVNDNSYPEHIQSLALNIMENFEFFMQIHFNY